MAFLLRALSLFRLLGTVEAVKARAAGAAQDAAQLAAFYAIAAVIGVIAVLFLNLALFFALATVWPAHWAAFAVFALLLLIAVAIVLYARQQPRRRFLPPPPVRSQVPPMDAQTEEIAGAIRSGIRRHPLAIALGAIAVGLALGLSSRRDDS